MHCGPNYLHHPMEIIVCLGSCAPLICGADVPEHNGNHRDASFVIFLGTQEKLPPLDSVTGCIARAQIRAAHAKRLEGVKRSWAG